MPGAWEIVGQVARNVVEAVVLATLLKWLKVETVRRALRVGLLVWLGFQAMAVLGSVLHEQYPFGLYLLHTGDALMTTVITVLILGRWRR
jgi:hypothetical protein